MNLLVIRADSTTKIGVGHVMRCIALGQAWQYNGGKVVFISHCESAALKKRLTDEGFDFISLDKPHPDSFDLEYTLSTLHKLSTQHKALSTWLVVDGYHFDSAYQQSIKEAGLKLLWIDDYGHADHYWADIVLNQNISAKDTFYQSRELHTRLLLGSKYVLLRKEFWPWKGWRREIAPIAKKILVTMGGADPENATLKIVRALKKMDQTELDVRVVVGPSYPHYDTLQDAAQTINCNIEILKDVKDMPELMAWADLAIAAGGSTCWELLYMGLPFVSLILAENQRGLADELGRWNLAANLGWHEQVDKFLVHSVVEALRADPTRRRAMSDGGRKLVDGNGARLVLQPINCWGVNE